MKTIRLAPGAEIPDDGDCISIDRTADDRFELTATALDGETSTAIIDGQSYPDADAAEAAGIAWANAHGVERLYILRED